MSFNTPRLLFALARVCNQINVPTNFNLVPRDLTLYTIVADMSSLKELLDLIRSDDDDEKKLTINKIPELILKSTQRTDHTIDQLLLVIYNLNTDSELQEKLTIGNRDNIYRFLLRLYVDTIKDHQPEQIKALVKLIDHANSSQMLIELANVFNNCGHGNNKETNDIIDDAFNALKDRAAVNLYPDALLMLHSIQG